MKIKLPIARLCLKVYVCLSGVQIAYAGWKRDPDTSQAEGQFMAQMKATAMAGANHHNEQGYGVNTLVGKYPSQLNY